MKKLMIVAMAMAAGATFADTAITSANIVGYSGQGTGDGNNFLAVAFNDIGFNTADIQQIVIDDGGAGTIGMGGEDFSVWEGLPTVVEGSGFFYWDASADPSGEATSCYWGDDSFEKAEFSITPGQGVTISCGEDLTIRASGQVPEGQVSFTTIEGNNFTGNPFPAEIDIQAIKIDDGGAGTIGMGGEDFSIWQGLPSVVEGSGFFYWDASADPSGEATSCYWGDDSFEKATYPIAAGQGFVISCAADLTITIDPPYTLSK